MYIHVRIISRMKCGHWKKTLKLWSLASMESDMFTDFRTRKDVCSKDCIVSRFQSLTRRHCLPWIASKSGVINLLWNDLISQLCVWSFLPQCYKWTPRSTPVNGPKGPTGLQPERKVKKPFRKVVHFERNVAVWTATSVSESCDFSVSKIAIKTRQVSANTEKDL
jgi:hypothetical protein